jgi:hypothetical protein
MRLIGTVLAASLLVASPAKAVEVDFIGGWRASYDYGEAWQWARSLAREERARLWNELLARNGFPGGCNVSSGGGS